MLAPILTGLLALAQASPATDSRQAADSLLRASLAVMGGTRLEALGSVRWTGMASEELPGISALAAPPIAMYREYSELRDVERHRLRRTSTVVLPQRPGAIAFTEVVTPLAVAQQIGDRVVAGSPSQWREGSATLRYGPERVLIHAIAAGDGVVGADTILAGRWCRTVAFDGGRAEVYLDREHRLPVGVAAVQTFPGDATWEMWGDVRTLTLFQAWGLTGGGLRLPHQLTVFRNGRLLRRIVIRNLEVDAAAPADSFAVGDEVVEAFRARAGPDPWAGTTVTTLAPGVVFLQGAFNMMLVRTLEGVVVIGAPHSAAYARRAWDEAARRFPGTPVTGVVLPSGTWPHMAGVREFIARGVPLYATPEVAAVVTAVRRAPHRLEPDSLAVSGTRLTLHRVDSLTNLGHGPNRLQLLPNRGPGATHTDQLAVYLPAQGLLFAADLYRPERFEPNLWLQPLAELHALLADDGIIPTSVAAMHIPPTPWGETPRPETGGTIPP